MVFKSLIETRPRLILQYHTINDMIMHLDFFSQLGSANKCQDFKSSKLPSGVVSSCSIIKNALQKRQLPFVSFYIFDVCFCKPCHGSEFHHFCPKLLFDTLQSKRLPAFYSHYVFCCITTMREVIRDLSICCTWGKICWIG